VRERPKSKGICKVSTRENSDFASCGRSRSAFVRPATKKGAGESEAKLVKKLLLAVPLLVAVSLPNSAWARRRQAYVYVGASPLSVTVGVGRAPVMVAAPPALVTVSPPPLVVVESPPPMVVAQAQVMVPVPVVVAAPVAAPFVQVVAPAPPKRRDEPARLGLKYLGGATTLAAASSNHGLLFERLGPSHTLGVEFRIARWLAMESDVEFRPNGVTWDALGLKLWMFPGGFFRPFVAVRGALNFEPHASNRMSLGVAGAAGVDLNFGKHFFLEAQASYRVLPGSCCGEVGHLTGQVGGGVAFF
jgi:hypothetical protein